MNSIYGKSDQGLDPAKELASTSICEAYGRTGIGGRTENQDALGGAFFGENVILTVCDGMGGMNGGRVASKIASTEIIQTMLDTPKDKWTPEAIAQAVNNANGAIYRRSMSEPQLRGMGTTTTILMLTREAAYLTHVGDSRIYQLRKGKKLYRTFDHSRVFEMVSQNMITEEQARTSSFSNVITRALGIRPQVEFKVEKLPYKKGDRFILCCDGVWNCEPEPRIIDYFNREELPSREVKYLTETVNGIGFGQGGNHDNLTAIVADVNCSSQYQYSIAKRLKIALGKKFSKKQKVGSKKSSKTNF